MVYGWQDFDQTVVKAIAGESELCIDKGPRGGMRCPVVGHEEWLGWRGQRHMNGTVPHGTPEVVFRAKPTYILSNPLDNFVVGRDLISAALGGDWGKAETHRLGHENSEDALTFNVFRSLQEAGELRRIASLVVAEPVEEPELFLWGRQIRKGGSSAAWDELKAVRARVEPTHRQQTEPDVCLYVRSWGWILIEAKFAFGIKTSESTGKLASWLARYPPHAQSLFDLERMARVRHREFPEQILRNVVFADLLRADAQHAHVVSLGRAGDTTPVSAWVSNCLRADCAVGFSQMTWEDIYAELAGPQLARLRAYFEAKSYSLAPAFDLDRAA